MTPLDHRDADPKTADIAPTRTPLDLDIIRSLDQIPFLDFPEDLPTFAQTNKSVHAAQQRNPGVAVTSASSSQLGSHFEAVKLHPQTAQQSSSGLLSDLSGKQAGTMDAIDAACSQATLRNDLFSSEGNHRDSSGISTVDVTERMFDNMPLPNKREEDDYAMLPARIFSGSAAQVTAQTSKQSTGNAVETAQIDTGQSSLEPKVARRNLSPRFCNNIQAQLENNLKSSPSRARRGFESKAPSTPVVRRASDSSMKRKRPINNQLQLQPAGMRLYEDYHGVTSLDRELASTPKAKLNPGSSLLYNNSSTHANPALHSEASPQQSSSAAHSHRHAPSSTNIRGGNYTHARPRSQRAMSDSAAQRRIQMAYRSSAPKNADVAQGQNSLHVGSQQQRAGPTVSQKCTHTRSTTTTRASLDELYAKAFRRVQC